MKNFKTILTSIFGICIVIGLGLFAMSKGSGSASASLIVWGTIPQEAFQKMYAGSSLAANKQVTVTYVEKQSSAFDSDFVNALADGKGPDIIIVRDDELYKNRARIFPLPYANYAQRDFKTNFVQAAEIFLGKDSIMALPLALDPMVLYWNRDMFTNALIATPPASWDTVRTLVPTLTKKDANSSILKSAIALGEWNNIARAKEILSLLFIQAGTPITATNSQGGVVSVLNDQFGYTVQPSMAALSFYTEFANPTSPIYSWNRSLPEAQLAFLSGETAMYVAPASETFTLQSKNPNLNFDVALIPQPQNAPLKSTYAHIYAGAIVKQSKSIAAAYTALLAFTEPAALTALESVMSLPPARRDLLATKPTDAYRVVFYNSALISKSWVDPDSLATNALFRDMIQNVTSGRSRVSEALSNAGETLTNLFSQ